MNAPPQATGPRPDASPTLREWLAAGPFGLGLSAGFFGFFAHAGLVSVLEEEGLWPELATGASAGALVAGLWGSGVSAGTIAGILGGLRREDFWDPGLGLGPGLLRGRRFRALLERHLAAPSFAACHLPVALSACDLLAWRTRVLASGPLAPAVHASCAFPLLFQPVWLSGRPFADGGILDRHGLAGMSAGRLLYHHLESSSPWRRQGSQALRLPSRPETVTLVIAGLPRLGPFRLERGPEALAHARAAVRGALDRPLVLDARGAARLSV
jgi:NTE family protein